MPAASDTRPTILLTGFGPFPGVVHNASADLVEALADRTARRFPKKCVVAHSLPTEWAAAAKQITALYAAHKPILALHFGVSANALGFCIETVAHNFQAPAHDAAGRLPATAKVVANGTEVLPVSIPAPKIVSRLQRLNLPASLSHDAGTYLCNSVLYRSLHLTERTGTQVGFVHIPVSFDHPSIGKFNFETAVVGGIEIIRTCLGLPPNRSQMLAVNRR